MKHISKTVLFAAACAAALAGITTPSLAEWPSDRPIRLIVGFGPGGGTDIVARIVAQPLQEMLKQAVVVENKPGAGGSIAGELVAKAPPDGYTASMVSTGHAISAVMVKSVRYDAVKDFVAAGRVADSTFVVVAHKDFPANDIKELIALAKKEPGKLNFGTVSVGSTQHFASELLLQMSGIDAKIIQYRTTPALVTALLSKESDFGIDLLHAVRGQVAAGELKLLAVGSPHREAALPNVPTVAEQGLSGYEVFGWYGWVYPAGTPQAIVDKTNAALKDILARPAIQEQLAKVGALAHYSTAAEFSKMIADDVAKWTTVRDKAGLEPQ
jgi:tripartite-type tricarboxylate transporter receptor subunit TctC